MRRTSPVLILLTALLLFASCATEPLKQAGMQGESTLGLVRDLASAYERKDIEAFMEKVSPAYPDRDGFRRSLEGVFSSYQTIGMKVQYTRLLISSLPRPGWDLEAISALRREVAAGGPPHGA